MLRKGDIQIQQQIYQKIKLWYCQANAFYIAAISIDIAQAVSLSLGHKLRGKVGLYTITNQLQDSVLLAL